MVNERIHIICVNCGGLEFKWQKFEQTEDEPFEFVLICENCSTIHPITEKFEMETK